MNYDRNRVFKEEFEKEFGELDGKKLWLLTKFAKNVRLRCRNNSAFNNFMGSIFPYATFRQVDKIGKDGMKYQGLSILVKGEELKEELPDVEDYGG